MTLFSSIIEDLVSKLNKKEKNKEVLASEITKTIGIQISPDQISVKDSTLILNISPTIKSNILLKKELILKTLERFGIKNIT